jgi:phage terminase large subunit-like protein
VVASTTPKPVSLIGELLEGVATGRTALSQMSTWDNEANLSPAFLSEIAGQYRGTSLEAQELDGTYLATLPGALWRREMFRHGPVPEKLRRVVIAVDPATTSGDQSDETGIVIAGTDSAGMAWVLGDYSLRGSPSQWASAVARACADFGATEIVAEANAGGEMIAHVLASIGVPLPPVELLHASKSKAMRAEPVSLLYEQGKVFHSETVDLSDLEDQLCLLCRDGFGGAGSPDRADAAVYAVSALCVEGIMPQVPVFRIARLRRRDGASVGFPPMSREIGQIVGGEFHLR